MKHLTKDQNQFIKHCLVCGAQIDDILTDFIEIYPKTIQDDKNEVDSKSVKEVKDLLTMRIKNIAVNEKEDIERLKELRGNTVVMPYLSATWRARYFRRLLAEADNRNEQTKILRELRAEERLLYGSSAEPGHHSDAEAHSEKEALVTKAPPFMPVRTDPSIEKGDSEQADQEGS